MKFESKFDIGEKVVIVTQKEDPLGAIVHAGRVEAIGFSSANQPFYRIVTQDADGNDVFVEAEEKDIFAEQDESMIRRMNKILAGNKTERHNYV